MACNLRIFSSLVGGGEGVLAELGGTMIQGLGRRVSLAEHTLIFEGDNDKSRISPCIANFVLLSRLSCRPTEGFLRDDIVASNILCFQE